MRELSVAEQRYQAVLAVIADGLSVTQVAEKVGVSRQSLHSWLARYEAEVSCDGIGFPIWFHDRNAIPPRPMA